MKYLIVPSLLSKSFKIELDSLLVSIETFVPLGNDKISKYFLNLNFDFDNISFRNPFATILFFFIILIIFADPIDI